MSDKNRLTQKQQRAVVALLSTATIEAAAKQAGVSGRTLHRWLDEPTFSAAVQRAEDEAIAAAVRKLVTLADSALNVLGVAMLDANNTPGVRVRAALGILDQLVKLREFAQLEERVRALETMLREGTREFAAKA